ncbi:MAG: DUF2911 domain-containing protein [Bacteroidota bacterium]
MKYLSYFLFFSLFVSVHSQNKFPKLSFPGQVEQLVGFDTISISYERPSVRGRKIFGELVPYGKLWRTGASYATRITFSNEVEIGGVSVPAGSYALLTIPEEDKWTLILNTEAKMYGTYGYDASKDLLRTEIPTQKSSRFYETLTIDIDVIPNDARIYLSWEETTAFFEVKTQTDAKVDAFLQDSLLTGISDDWEQYALAVEHLLYHNMISPEVLSLADFSIQKGGESYAYAMRVRALISLKRYEEALEAIAVGEEYDVENKIEGGTFYEEAKAEIKALRAE